MNANISTNTPPPLPQTRDNHREKNTITELYPHILRWVGAITLGAAAICFLITGWAGGSSLFRVGGFLSFTILLSICGIVCTYRWEDDKGARTFLALATAFLPANFTQLGAIIHAELTHASSIATQSIQKIFVFTPLGFTTLLITSAITIVTLIPIAILGFKALVGSGSRRMTMLYLCANALLLLPVRDPNYVSLIVATLTTAVVLADRSWFSISSNLKTWDGIAMRSLLYLPSALILARNLIMYPMSPYLLSLTYLLLAFFFFQGLPRILPESWMKITVQHLAYPLGLISWNLLLEGLVGDLNSMPNYIELPLIILPWAVAVFALSLIAHGRSTATRFIIAVISTCVCLSNLLQYGDVSHFPTVISMITGIALLLSAFILEEKTPLLCGISTILIGIAYHLHYAFSLIQQNLWISLAIAGTGIILISSILERHGHLIRQRASTLRNHWLRWN